MKKIKAYTLLEVTVAMLLSAICITICYSAYGIIGKYYTVFQAKNQQATEVLGLKQVLARDFLKSRFVLKSEDGFELIRDSVLIRYSFSAGHVLRQLNTLHTDTFHLEPSELLCFFEGRPVDVPDTVDQVQFKLSLAKGVRIPLQVNKVYSAENLVN
ncbi:hypothetical protein GM921_09845 [Pedobacter sp. LMG 31464]|uniref:Prepilin-type N-terminal cleavage/methylation domain-containing protein n=1 Tax=Pedobacter planticolens TaxID=2679964 RepID=A0A923DXD3_9SPHI|nr:prepilin-type N-terminal cleavage/methylation domain-containing protein [Pedobacter planticolens]MBB2145789.1 hypothetical protein [Pedobacter planticolens]